MNRSRVGWPRCLAGVVLLVSCARVQPGRVAGDDPGVHIEESGATLPPGGRDEGDGRSKAAMGPTLAPSEPPRRVADASSQPPPLPEGTTVLHIGDSFAGALGLELNKQLRAAKIRSVLKYRTASYIVDWAHREPLRDYMFQYRPDLVLVTLGANELEMAEPERRIPAIEKIVKTIGDKPCIWVGVPLWDGAHNGLPEIIERHAAPCRYLDTNALFPNMPRARDRIHPTMQARQDWATRVVHWLAKERRPTEERVWALARPEG